MNIVTCSCGLIFDSFEQKEAHYKKRFQGDPSYHEEALTDRQAEVFAEYKAQLLEDAKGQLWRDIHNKLPIRVKNAFRRRFFSRGDEEVLYELIAMTPAEVLRMRGIGWWSLQDIAATLAQYGLRLGMSEEEIESYFQEED